MTWRAPRDPAAPWTTYRRADGDEIFGEYSFVCDTDGLDDCDEGATYIKETWALISTEHVWHGPARLEPCEACGGSGIDQANGLSECAACDGEGNLSVTTPEPEARP